MWRCSGHREKKRGDALATSNKTTVVWITFSWIFLFAFFLHSFSLKGEKKGRQRSRRQRKVVAARDADVRERPSPPETPTRRDDTAAFSRLQGLRSGASRPQKYNRRSRLNRTIDGPPRAN